MSVDTTVLEGLGERFFGINRQRPTQVPVSGDTTRVSQDVDFECFHDFLYIGTQRSVLGISDRDKWIIHYLAKFERGIRGLFASEELHEEDWRRQRFRWKEIFMNGQD